MPLRSHIFGKELFENNMCIFQNTLHVSCNYNGTISVLFL